MPRPVGGNRRPVAPARVGSHELKSDPTRKAIFQTLKSWHDPAKVSDAQVNKTRALLEKLPHVYAASTGPYVMKPSDMSFDPVRRGSKSAVDDQGWVRATLKEPAGWISLPFPLNRQKTWHVKFNLFADPIKVVND